MEEEIRKNVSRIKLSYILFWLLPLALIVLGETNFLPVGLMADNGQVCYLWDTVVILLTAIVIPVSLKLFGKVLDKKINKQSIISALSLYRRWSLFRLVLLEVVIVVGLFDYYLTMGTTGYLCSLISLTASLFCIPGERRLRFDLHIDSENL